MLGRLEAKKDEWARLGTPERAELLRRTLKCVIQVGATPAHLTSPMMTRAAAAGLLIGGAEPCWVQVILQGNVARGSCVVGAPGAEQGM